MADVYQTPAISARHDGTLSPAADRTRGPVSEDVDRSTAVRWYSRAMRRHSACIMSKRACVVLAVGVLLLVSGVSSNAAGDGWGGHGGGGYASGSGGWRGCGHGSGGVYGSCYAKHGSMSVAQLQPVPTYLEPPRPIGTIEFLEESGVERWHVMLDGQDAQLRIKGSGCSFMGEIFKGMTTPLYDNMTFTTSGGKQCTVTAIER